MKSACPAVIELIHDGYLIAICCKTYNACRDSMAVVRFEVKGILGTLGRDSGDRNRNLLTLDGTDGTQKRFRSPEKALLDSNRTDKMTSAEIRQ